MDYGQFIETTVAVNYDRVARKPWRFDRLERAWQLKAARRGAREHGIPAGQVYDDLRAAILRRARNPLWLLPSVPGLAYVLFQMVRGWAVWVAYSRFLGPRYAKRTVAPMSRVERSLPLPGARREAPVASVVVLSFNRLDYLQTTIESLYATAEAARFELIVVDNGSTDGSVEFLRGQAEANALDKVVLRRRNHGTSPGFNVGFAHADPRSRLLIKLDSDIVLLESGWLERVERFLAASPRHGAAALSQINHGILRWAPRRTVEGESVSSWDWFVCGGACMTIPRRVFEDVGWLNEEFDLPYMPDDLDYAMRLSYLDYEAYYLQDCRTYHRAELDHRRYRHNNTAKHRELKRVARRKESEMYRRYASGETDPRLRYEHYAQCSFPDGRRVISID